MLPKTAIPTLDGDLFLQADEAEAIAKIFLIVFSFTLLLPVPKQNYKFHHWFNCCLQEALKGGQ